MQIRLAPVLGLPWWLSDKESTCQCRRHGLNPWAGSLTQEDPLEKEMATHPSILRAWQATVHGVPNSQIQLNDKHFLWLTKAEYIRDYSILDKGRKLQWSGFSLLPCSSVVRALV